MSTALAGLGIGGLAIGFGAQKTIENLFGGVSVLGDEVFRVGDVCRFGDRTGVVEDIGLRSTRIRTDERTLVAIPNGTVATINLENLSRRDKILFKTNLGLRLDSKPDHMRFVLAEIRRLLYSHPKVETKTVRVRLIDIAGSSLSIELVVLHPDARLQRIRRRARRSVAAHVGCDGRFRRQPGASLADSVSEPRYGRRERKSRQRRQEDCGIARREETAFPRLPRGGYFFV